MAQGIKVVTENTPQDTTNPRQITLDTRQLGAMKIVKRLWWNCTLVNMTSTYLNGAGVTIGKIQYAHTLGYSPAFQLYQYNRLSHGSGELCPTLSAFGGPNLQAMSDSLYVTIDGIDMTTPSSTVYFVLLVFAENLDLTVV